MNDEMVRELTEEEKLQSEIDDKRRELINMEGDLSEAREIIEQNENLIDSFREGEDKYIEEVKELTQQKEFLTKIIEKLVSK